MTAHWVKMMINVLFIYFCQLKEASAALQKTSQQVQKLVQLVNKPSPCAPLHRSPGQPPSQTGDNTHSSGSVEASYLCESIIYLMLKVYVCVACLPSRYSGFSASSVCITGSISVNDPAKSKCARGWAQGRDEHSGKETHQDVAQRHPCCYQPCWCVTRTFLSFFEGGIP